MPKDWRDLARVLGGIHRQEDGGGTALQVVFGELPACEFTVLGFAEGTLVVELDYSDGEDASTLAGRVCADPDLRRAVTDAGGAPPALNPDRFRLSEGCATLIWTGAAPRPRVEQLEAVVRRFAQVVTAHAPPRDRLCLSCAAREAEVGRPFGHTIRLCESCVRTMRTEQDRLAAAEAALASVSGPERPPFPLPESLSNARMNAESRRLRELHDRSPSAYWAALLALVVVGQAALAGGAAAVLVLLAAAGLLALFLAKSGAGLLVALKLLAMKGAKLFLVGLVAVGALLSGFWNAVTALFRKPPVHELGGERVERGQAPRLYEWLDVLAEQVDAPKVDLVLLDRDCNCAAAELRDGPRGFRRVVQIGLPILEMFDREEFRSIMAHELGHLRRRDARSNWVYRTATSWMDVAWRAQDMEGGSPLRAFAGWYVPRFFLHAQVIMRRAEYEADRRAATVADPEVCARSLVKVAVLSSLYGDALGRGCHRRALASNPEPPDLVGLAREGLAGLPEGRVQQALQIALEEEPSWLDTHPVLRQRLENLGVDPPGQVTLDLVPVHPATDLVDGYGDLRRRLLEPIHESLRVHLDAQQRSLGMCLRRLDQPWDPARAPHLVRRARWLYRLDRDEEALDAYSRALALEPGHGAAARERIEVLSWLGRMEDCADAFQDLLEREPGDLTANFRAWDVFRRVGRTDQAAACLRRLLDSNPPLHVRETLEGWMSGLPAAA